jgi:hypothetical protein
MGTLVAVPIACWPVPLEALLPIAILTIPKRWRPKRQMENRDRRVQRSHNIAKIMKKFFRPLYRINY